MTRLHTNRYTIKNLLLMDREIHTKIYIITAVLANARAEISSSVLAARQVSLQWTAYDSGERWGGNVIPLDSV